MEPKSLPRRGEGAGRKRFTDAVHGEAGYEKTVTQGGSEMIAHSV